MTELLYGNRKTAILNVEMPSGDDRYLPFTHTLGDWTNVAEARLAVKDAFGNVVIASSLEENAADWDTDTANEGSVLISSTASAIPSGQNYRYEVELIDNDGIVTTVQRGTFTVSWGDIVDNDGSAPYLSWSTRDDLDLVLSQLRSEITQLETCGNFSELTVAVAGGEGSLTVKNGAIFDGQDIRVSLDNGSFEDDSVASVSGNVLTLTGTISGVAAIGNKVRVI